MCGQESDVSVAGRWSRRVEPSISVNRKGMVPVGGSRIWHLCRMVGLVAILGRKP